MRFVLNQIILWLKDGYIRKLEFKPNQVNVITGDSNKGKTTILEIIDYCLCASKVDIPDEIINENIDWYGINFEINRQKFTIARGQLDGKVGSTNYYFSSIGEIPLTPVVNIEEKELKHYLEKEFSIDSDVVIPYGGKVLKSGSKISLRYFLMFNTQTGDTISHSRVFFDKQDDDKYREALERIFDLATGIDNIENSIIKGKIAALEKEIARLERKKNAYEKEERLFENNISSLIQKAKEYDLIDRTYQNSQEDLLNLKAMILNNENENFTGNAKKLEVLYEKRRNLLRKIRNLNSFKNEYNRYKQLAANTYDSLKPIKYIKDNFSEATTTLEFSEILSDLQHQMSEIKKEIANRTPLNLNVEEYVKVLNGKLLQINKDIERCPKDVLNFQSQAEKYMFIGEVKTKIEMYEKKWDDQDYGVEISKKQEDLDGLNNRLGDRKDQKQLVIKLLEELIQHYLEEASEALENYAGYKAMFDYTQKRLYLKKPFAVNSSVVGSSSNHLFLHLCFFLGLHELIMRQKVPYIPQLLLLDQPSRPYYEAKKEADNLQNIDEVEFEDIVNDDRRKITIAFKLLNDFILRINKELGEDFQIIVVEHIPDVIWKEANLEKVHLVDNFRYGNALIPNSYLKKIQS